MQTLHVRSVLFRFCNKIGEDRVDIFFLMPFQV